MSTIPHVRPGGRRGDSFAVRALRFGDVVATYVVDGTVTIRPRAFFPDIPGEEWAAWPELVDARGEMPMSTGGLLIERGGRRLLIDAGVGPLASEFVYGFIECGSLLDVLATLGRRPEDVDVLAFTHLHFDHVGWAFDTDGSTAKTFPNARYVLSAPEWAHHADHPDHADTTTLPQVIDSLTLTHTVVSDGEEIFPGVRAAVTAGHTPGHTAYVITSATGERLIAFGDAFHSPAQLAHPEWLSAADADASGVVAARRQLLAELLQPNTFGFGVHFGDQAFGRVITDHAGVPKWQPVPATAVPGGGKSD